MNLLTFPTAKFSITPKQQMNDEYFNFFTINNQNMQYWLSNDGHLTPTRTDSDLTTLSTAQYTGRYAYNMTTDSPMTNVAGTYLNISTFAYLSSQTQLLAKNAEKEKSRMHFYPTEDGRVFVSVGGKMKELQLKEIA